MRLALPWRARSRPATDSGRRSGRQWRRPTVAAALVVSLGAVAVAGGVAARDRAPAQFAVVPAPTPPFVPQGDAVSATWFCAGVPLTDRGVGERGLGGAIVVANHAGTPLEAFVTVFSSAEGAVPAEQSLEVPAFGTATVDLGAIHEDGEYVAAMVEIPGGRGYVEQRADHRDGSAVSPCSNSTSPAWYLADNYTLNDSQEDLVITNPFPDMAIVDVEFATRDGRRAPQALQGLPVPGRSIRVVSEDTMPKDEAILAAEVIASRGRVVVARAQRYVGERQGFSLTLASPTISTEWWFADGERSDEVAFERYSIFNPGDEEITVDMAVLGVMSDEFVPYRSDVVPAGRVISYTTKELPNLPEGRHFLTFSTQGRGGIVVERGLTRRAGERGVITAVILGAPSDFLGFRRWSMAIGTGVPVEAMIIVANLDYLDGTVTVLALGPGGERPVPGLESVPLPASGVIAISIPDELAAFGVPLVVESTQRIIVERSLPRSADRPGRSASLALPG